MHLAQLDHVNVRTANPEAMIEWYGRVLDLKPGARPPFKFPGAWLYAGDVAAIHLLEVNRAPKAGDLRLEHFAFSATGLTEFIARLEREGVDYRTRKVPEWGILQVNLWDPDRNHIHVDFSPEEAVEAGL